MQQLLTWYVTQHSAETGLIPHLSSAVFSKLMFGTAAEAVLAGLGSAYKQKFVDAATSVFSMTAAMPSLMASPILWDIAMWEEASISLASAADKE